MYPDSGYKTTHAQSVCTRPFSRGEGPGDEAMCGRNVASTVILAPSVFFSVGSFTNTGDV